MKPRSIRRRALAIVLLVQTGFALALGSATVWHEWRGRMHGLDVQIAGHSDSLLGAIQDAEDPEDNITIDSEELRLPADDRYAVYSDSGKLIGRSTRGSLLPRDGAKGIHTVEMDGVRYRVLRRSALRIIDRAEFGGVGLRRPVVMLYASPIRHAVHETTEAVGFTLVSLAIAAMLSGLFAWWLLRATLSPISELASVAGRVSSASLHFEPPASAMQVEELEPLARTLSSLIAELREAFAKEQRFVSDAAHELKTAVAVARSSVQLLMMRRRTEDEYVQGLGEILADTDRLEALVGSMLELARFEQGSPECAAFELGDAARAAIEAMRSVADAKGVSIQADLPAHTPVCLDAHRAETLVINLLSNAIRHSSSGAAVSVVIRQDQGKVALEVIDRGSGISAASLPHVFERFYREDPSRSRASGGTGLGLSICKSIVESAGGTIAIESHPGDGTKVTAVFSKA